MRARPDRWLWGALPAAALGFGLASHPTWRFEAVLVPRVEAALRAAAETHEVSWATARVSGRDAVLSGEAPSPQAQRAILSALEATPGLRRAVDLTGSFPVASPFAWSASRQGDRLTLLGVAPRGPVRGDILRQARALAPGLAVEDRAITASGQPERFAEAASVSLEVLALLDPGTAAIVDEVVTVEGMAPSTDAFEAVTASLRELPEGFRLGSAAILPPLVAPFTWSARRSGDAIAIAGHAPSLAARERLAQAARRLNPSARVSLDLRVARGLPPGLDYEAATELLLAQLPRMGDGEVGLVGDVLRVSGATADKNGAAQVAASLDGAMPAGFRLGGLSLVTVRPQPYRFEARRSPGRLLLAGHLPDEAARGSVRSLVRRRFFTEVVDDQLRLADGAPAGFLAGVSLGLEQLSFLAEGEASLREMALVVSGESLYEQTAERMRAEIHAAPPGAALPPGFTAQVDIRVRREAAKRGNAQP